MIDRSHLESDRPTIDRSPVDPLAVDFDTVRATDRRTVLRAGGVAALAVGGVAAGVGLAGCSGPSSTAPTSSAPTSSAPQTAGPQTASPQSPGGGPAAGSVTVAVDQVPVGGGVILPDAPYVVTQPEQGAFKAFSKTCTHQGCAVSKLTETAIVCVCHGSEFSLSDGSVLAGPAETPLPSFGVEVEGSNLVVG